MRKLFILILLLSLKLSATNYYVSNSGSDSNNGLSTSTSWQTLGKVASFTFSNGDSILLKRGDTFTAAKINVNTGVNFGSYGSGEKPIISGLYSLTGFTQVNDSLYSKTVNVTMPSFILFDGKAKDKGAYPDNSYNYTLDAVSGSDLTDVLFNGKNFVGGEIVLKLNEWTQRIDNITAHTGSTITVTINGGSPSTGDNWFIQNDVDVFNENGDWAYVGGVFYIHSENAITLHSVQIPICDTLFSCNSSSNISVDDLDVRGINQYFVLLGGSGNIKVNNCDIQYVTSAFVGTNTGDKLSVIDNTFTDIFGDGIVFYGRPDSTIITGNQFNNIGSVKGLGGNFKTHRYSAIETGVSINAILQYNFIDSIGYNGITGNTNSGIGKFYVLNNYVKNTNLHLIDGGGLYFSASTTDTIYLTNNIIENSSRNIYQDYGGKNCITTGNLSIGGDYGYYTNDGKNSQISNNIFWENTTNYRFVQWSDSSTLGYLDDFKFYKNISYNASFVGMEYSFGSVTVPDKTWPSVDFGILDTNIYIGDDYFRLGNSSLGVSNYTFAQYQALGYEPNATLLTGITPTLEYNATIAPKTVTFTGYRKTDAYGNTYDNSITLQPFESVVFVSEAVIIPYRPSVAGNGGKAFRDNGKTIVF